jgi:hypothetical protein
MSIFYLIPPRPLVGDRFASFLQDVFPGLDWDSAERLDLAEVLGDAARGRAGVYVVYRDDLPLGESPARALLDGFGAGPGDEVVEVRLASPGELCTRRWQLPPGGMRDEG